MLFFFDIRDGSDYSRDDVGIELPDAATAKQQATLALTEMARDRLPSDGDERILSIHVRTPTGPQFEVSLEYEAVVVGELTRDGNQHG